MPMHAPAEQLRVTKSTPRSAREAASSVSVRPHFGGRANVSGGTLPSERAEHHVAPMATNARGREPPIGAKQPAPSDVARGPAVRVACVRSPRCKPRLRPRGTFARVRQGLHVRARVHRLRHPCDASARAVSRPLHVARGTTLRLFLCRIGKLQRPVVAPLPSPFCGTDQRNQLVEPTLAEPTDDDSGSLGRTMHF